MGKYDDILHLPHPVSTRRARMSRLDRAAQFAPFAALTGFGGVISESGRLTEDSIQLEEDRKLMLNETLQRILAGIHRQPEVSVTCFQPDERKNGGAYVTVSGSVKKIDAYAHAIVLTDGKTIPIDTVIDICMEEE